MSLHTTCQREREQDNSRQLQAGEEGTSFQVALLPRAAPSAAPGSQTTCCRCSPTPPLTHDPAAPINATAAAALPCPHTRHPAATRQALTTTIGAPAVAASRAPAPYPSNLLVDAGEGHSDAQDAGHTRFHRHTAGRRLARRRRCRAAAPRRSCRGHGQADKGPGLFRAQQ